MINNFQQTICFYEHFMFIRTAFFISSGRFNLISLCSEKRKKFINKQFHNTKYIIKLWR